VKRALASAATVAAILGAMVLASLGSLACQKTYRLQPPAHAPEAIAREIAGRSLHEGDNLLVDLDSHKLVGEIRKGELRKLRLEVDGEKLDELALGALARANPAPPPSGETPMSCEQKEERCLRNCRRTASGRDYECCELRCLFNRMSCDLGWNPPGWGGGFSIL